MLGSTLPAVLHEWHLTDGAGGLLLLAGWGGSTLGAVFSRGHYEETAAAGLLLSGVALFTLSSPHAHGLLPLYFLYGLGLGLTMTAISLLQAREALPESADLELNRLNLLWAAGACLAPALAVRSLRLLSVGGLYRLLSLCFALTAAALLLTLWRNEPRQSRAAASSADQASPERGQLAWAPLPFLLFAATSVGLESAIGSWLTTFAGRNIHGVGIAAFANSAFWLGLLLSRAAHSVQAMQWLAARTARTLHLFVVGAALALLIAAPGRLMIPCAGLLCGLGLGPLYPYVLSMTLPRFRSTMVFVLAGVGSAAVPWLTGVLSSAGGSLRIGLLAPAATFLVLLASNAAMNADTRRSAISVTGDNAERGDQRPAAGSSGTLRSR